MTLPGIRTTNLLIAIFTLVMMLAAVIYFQEMLHLIPCPLCVSQRVFAIGVGAIALIAFIHNPGTTRGRKIYAALTALVAIGGSSVSGRQVWLQSLPEDQIPACGPTLDWMFTAQFPLQEIMSAMFFGEGSCAEIKWQLFGISIPGWTLVAFIFLIAVSVFQFIRVAKQD
jgi:disulfide bond formation protein DsbB